MLSITNNNTIKILRKRYLKKNAEGEVIETPEDMFRRVAKTAASVELNYGKSNADAKNTEEEFFEIMTSLNFLPNSPTLMNGGRKIGQLSACFVLPVDDSMDSIFDAVKAAAIIHKSGGGTGFSFSRLRPKGDIVGSTKGVSSGPVSFMTVFDAATEAVKQGGTRRGANMGLLRVDHPDILDFISCKENEGNLSNFNISVGLTEEFMVSLKQGDTYSLVNPRTKKRKEISAKDVFNKLVEMAWKNGEPGIVFIDRINEYNPTPHIGQFEATNPCGEQPLLPYESCNLGSINLSNMVKDNIVNVDLLIKTIRLAVNFLDNIIDINKYPLPQIEEATKANRKIGLGIMGWADMLLKLRIKYNSEEALKLAEEIMSLIRSEAYQASEYLAKERGVFPTWDGSIHSKNNNKVRNAAITTIAPTGTLSIIADCSSGIEPVFEWVRKSQQADMELLWEHEIWARYKNNPLLPEYFVTAGQISPEWHVRMQAAFQKYTDNAISKTINMIEDATKEDVSNAYMLAYELGCKGLTIYRNQSRKQQVFTSLTEKKLLPDVVDEKRVKIETNEGKYYIHLSHINGEPKEIFVNVPPSGSSRPWVECISRLMSQAMRHGVPCEKLISQLYKSYMQYGDVTSPLLAIIKGLNKALESLGKSLHHEIKCPECKDFMVLEEGCMSCKGCGFSRC